MLGGRFFASGCSIILLLSLWQLICAGGFVNRSLFPPPTDVAGALAELAASGELLLHVESSLWRVLLGLGIGALIGIIFGLVTGRVKLLDDALGPLFNVLRSFPPVALIPLMIVWFGIGDGAKVFAISFAVFFPVWVGAHSGAGNISARYIQAASTLTRSNANVWLKVILPASTPFIIAGVRMGIAVAFIMVFVSELAGASSGLGYLIAVSQMSYRMDRMMAGLFVLGIMGAATDRIFTYTVGRLIPWSQKIG